MKSVSMKKIINDNSNELLNDIIKSIPEIRFITKIDDALKARGLTQAKLATLTGLRPTTISEIISGARFALTKSHIASIMIALRITDIREIVDIVFDEPTVEQFAKERQAWLKDKVIPDEVAERYSKNARELFNPDIRA